MFPLDLLRRVARDRLDLDVEELASGHLPAFGHPEALAQSLMATMSPERSLG